jgi:hypothetical protein
MPKFRIPYSYKLGGYVVVEAETLEQAKDIAVEASVDNTDNEHCLDDSFEIDDDFCQEVVDSTTQNC